jgi:hypothetical protein
MAGGSLDFEVRKLERADPACVNAPFDERVEERLKVAGERWR